MVCANDARSDEKDSSDEGAADLTILKPFFLPWKVWNERIDLQNWDLKFPVLRDSVRNIISPKHYCNVVL